MKSRSVFSRRILLFIIILALTSQACAISLLEWPSSSHSRSHNSNRPSGTHTHSRCRAPK